MGDAGGIWAVVPVKEIGEAKQRLAVSYAPAFRQGLVRAMVEDVLAALAAAPLAGLVVVTLDPVAADLARRYGARIFETGARDGQTGAVRAAVARLAAEGCRTMLTMPGDIPRVTADEVRQLIAKHKAAPAFSIVPAHDQRGSNAILCSPPDVVPLSFGNDSFLPHLDTARRHGIEPTIVPLPGIGLDIDNPIDLELFMRERSQTRAWRYLEAQGLVPASAKPKGHAA